MQAHHTFNPLFRNGEWTSPYGVTTRLADLRDYPDSARETNAAFVLKEAALGHLFNQKEVSKLLAKRLAISNTPGERKVVLVSYENPWGSSGGVLAVARMAANALRDAGEEVFRLSAYHSNLKDSLDLRNATLVAKCDVPLVGSTVTVSVYKVEDKNSAHGSWYLVSAPGYFNLDGGAFKSEPYFDSSESQEDREGRNSRLLKDSLLFSKAVPYVLKALGYTKDLVIEAQDWQCAFAAQAVLEAQLGDHPVLETAAVFLTLHNPYDHWLPSEVLGMFTERLGSQGDTVLQRMIELTAGPVSTVSNGFAVGLTQSPLQRHHYAPHLLETFSRHGLIGITNGSLAALDKPFTPEAYTQAELGDLDKLIQEKDQARSAALKALSQHLGDSGRQSIGCLKGGNTGYVSGDISTLDKSVPIFVCYGRFDLGQKGIDIFVDAITKMPRGAGRYVLISWPGSSDEYVGQHFEHYERVAAERDGEFIFFPERRPEFQALMKGATWGCYPSLYEPFGSMADCLVNTTGVVYRAVDGLLHQAMPPAQKLYIPEGASDTSYAAPFSPIVGYHEGTGGMNEDRLRDEVVSLQNLLAPKDRGATRLFELKSSALAAALTQASLIYSTGNREAYFRGLSQVASIPQPWTVNAQQRQAWYGGWRAP